MSNCDIKLFDRVKQKSTSTGTGNFELSSSVAGFKDFADVYADQDVLFYCINDGTNFEIGSGIFNSGATPTIQRNVFYSSASDNSIIDFAAGTKEIFVTYPATHSVSIGSGIGGITLPQKSGIAFWNCNNILDYDSGLVFDKDNKRVGIRRTNPAYAIDVGGDGSDQSMIRASGYHVGPTGIHFPSGNGDEASYSGGIQFQHFEKNELLGADTQSVLGLSGIVNQDIYFKKQTAGTFFAGPASGCAPPCSPNYPNFRRITLDDIPSLVEVSGFLQGLISNNSSSIGSTSGYLQNQITSNDSDIISISGIAQDAYDASGYLRTDLITVSGIAQDAYDASGYLRADLTTISGIAQDAYDASGTLRTDLTAISGTLNSKIDTEIIQLSGATTHNTNSIYGFGNNNDNQIKPTRDIYEPNHFHYPVLVSCINNVSGIFFGQSRSFVLVNNNGSGELYGQGFGSYTVDGINNSITSPLTRIHSDKNWRSFSAGFSHNVGIDADGKMYIWGSNVVDHESVWGDENVSRGSDVAVPIMEIGSGIGWSGVSCGWWFTLAISNSGYLYGWGDSENVGQGNTGDVSGVTQIGTRKWTQIAAGANHSLAISSGELFGFGVNEYGELGPSGAIGPFSVVPTPSSIPSYPPDKIYAGNNISSYIDGDLIYIFGRNNYGQLADGTKIDNSGVRNGRTYFNYLKPKSMSLGRDLIAIQNYDNELYFAGRIPDNEIFYEALYPKKLNFKNITHFDIDQDTGLFYAD